MGGCQWSSSDRHFLESDEEEAKTPRVFHRSSNGEGAGDLFWVGKWSYRFDNKTQYFEIKPQNNLLFYEEDIGNRRVRGVVKTSAGGHAEVISYQYDFHVQLDRQMLMARFRHGREAAKFGPAVPLRRRHIRIKKSKARKKKSKAILNTAPSSENVQISSLPKSSVDVFRKPDLIPHASSSESPSPSPPMFKTSNDILIPSPKIMRNRRVSKSQSLESASSSSQHLVGTSPPICDTLTMKNTATTPHPFTSHPGTPI